MPAPSPARCVSRHRALVLLVLAVLLVPLPAHADPPVVPTRVEYRRPVPDAVVRAYQAPASRFGAGHRGVDFGATPGDVVRTAAAGRVRHAGSVAGTVWVSVEHADGVVTSYGPLTARRVSAGAQLAGGTVLGRLAAGGHGHGGADRGLHWGARRAGAYFDPLTLLDPPPGRPSLVGPGAWGGAEPAVTPYDPYPGGSFWVPSSPVAQAPGYAVAPNPNHLVLLPGLGSSSERTVLDAAHLGYAPDSVTAWSYAGRDPDAGGDRDDPRRDQAPYGPEHTWDGVDRAARLLAEQLRAQHAREPGRPVDLLGHSMGGVVSLWYLLVYHDPYDPTLPQIGHVVTVASPLQGSDAASLAEALDNHQALAWLSGLQRDLQASGHQGPLARLPLDAPAIEQLAPGSSLLEALAAGWGEALRTDGAGPLATGTQVLTVAGSHDLVVGAYAAQLPAGSEPVVLPGGHSSVLETEAVREVIWDFLAGEPVVTSSGSLAQAASEQVGDVLQTLAQLTALHGWWTGRRR